MKTELTIVFEWSEDGWWVAEIAEVPGAVSQGRTKDEARENVLDALELLMETRRDMAIENASAENVETVSLAS